ncbi:MAG: hypothetical protein ABL899_03170, partial [Nitrospira sp.]
MNIIFLFQLLVVTLLFSMQIFSVYQACHQEMILFSNIFVCIGYYEVLCIMFAGGLYLVTITTGFTHAVWMMNLFFSMALGIVQ